MEETSSIKHECRLCLEVNAEKNIFDKTLNIYLKIFKYCSIKVSQDDGLPELVCNPCHDKLFEIEKFIKKCKESDKFLRIRRDQFGDGIKTEGKSDDETGDFKEEIEHDFYQGSEIVCHESHKSEQIQFFPEKEQSSDCIEYQLDYSDETVYVSCPSCEKFFKDDDYSDHIKQHFDNVTCSVCFQCFASQVDLDVHFESHKNEKKFCCEFCQNKYKAEETYTKHLKLVHGVQKQKKPRTVRKIFHKENDKNEEIVACDECGKSVKMRYLKKHYEIHSGNKYICDMCSKCYTSLSLLKIHIQRHGLLKDKGCNVCNKTFYTSRDLNRHQVSVHKVAVGKPKLEDEYVICAVCGKSCKRGRINQHYSIHSTESFSCDICSKTFRTKKKLKIHIDRHDWIKNVPCGVCGSMFKSKDSLRKHVRFVHLNERNYACELCHKKFKSKKCRELHMVTHTRERNHECELCGKAYGVKSALQIHKRVHANDRRYGCQYCHKRFFTSTDLKEHERLHTGERPHKCPVCGKGFAQRCNMKSHFKYNHRELDFKKTEDALKR